MSNQPPNDPRYGSPQPGAPNDLEPPSFRPVNWSHSYQAAPYMATQYPRSSLAVPALVLALLSMVCCGVFTALPALIMGWLDLRAISDGRTDPDKRGMAIAAVVVGSIWLVLGLIGIFYYIFLFTTADFSTTG